MFWSCGLVKSRQKNWRESRSRETEVGEKIAPATTQEVERKNKFIIENFWL